MATRQPGGASALGGSGSEWGVVGMERIRLGRCDVSMGRADRQAVDPPQALTGGANGATAPAAQLASRALRPPVGVSSKAVTGTLQGIRQRATGNRQKAKGKRQKARPLCAVESILALVIERAKKYLELISFLKKLYEARLRQA